MIPQLVASPQHLNKILDTPPMGVGAGTGAGVGVFVEVAYRQQAEVAVVKLVYILPYRLLCNLINRLRSKHVVL